MKYVLDFSWTLSIALLAVMGAALMTAPSRAAVLTFTDQAIWESALNGAAALEDFEDATTDVLFGLAFQPAQSPNGDLWLQANANFDNNASIDIAPYISADADINGNVVVNLRFLDQGNNTNSQETVIVSLPAGISAFAFEYKNYDFAGDGTFLSFTGTNGQTVPAFVSTVDGFFGVIDTGASASISSFAFTGDPSTGTGTSVFSSFDDVRYGVGASAVKVIPEPTGISLVCTMGFIVMVIRRWVA